MHTDVHFVETAFDVTKRPIDIGDTSQWVQDDTGQRPQQSFVDVTDGTRGLAVFNRGLPEYTVLDDAKRTIALTLLRCVGQLQQPEFPAHRFERDRLCLTLPTPDAQCPGENVAEYALFPHAGTTRGGHVLRQARNYTVPLRAFLCPAGTAADTDWYLSLDSPHLDVSALKKSERGEYLAVRLFNPFATKTSCILRSRLSVAKAYEARLDESILGPVPVRTRHFVHLTLKPKQVRTILLEIRRLRPGNAR